MARVAIVITSRTAVDALFISGILIMISLMVR